MKRKDMVKDIIRTEIRQADGYEYRYYLSVTNSAKVASYNLPLYSVRVEMIGNEKHSEHELREIFADSGKAITFFEEIVENLVTPLDLHFILEDKIMI